MGEGSAARKGAFQARLLFPCADGAVVGAQDGGAGNRRTAYHMEHLTR